MAGTATQQSLRKYLGAIKDTTTVSLAKVNSEYKELDIAIVKATNHVETPPKEKYVKEILNSITAVQPRADVAYCIQALARRLSKTHNWAVALKTLIVIHHALREVDSTFREELINYGNTRSHMLNLAHFKDDSSAEAWDYSAWIRNYALFLEEKLECFRILKYDIETDLPKVRDLDTIGLLEQLPALQQLLGRLISCQPMGLSAYNVIIQHALSMVAVESIKIYSAISDGSVILVDKFFEMPRSDAVRAFDIYRRASEQAARLSEFYEVCKTIHIGRGERFLKIEQPPVSFLQTMEDYIREVARHSNAHKSVDEKLAPPKILPIEYRKSSAEPEPSVPPVLAPAPAPAPVSVAAPAPPPEPVKEEAPAAEPTDLLGMDDSAADAAELDQKNELALAIVPLIDDASPAAAPSNGVLTEQVTTGWELALVTAPSSNESAITSSKLAGGLDLLTLDSLYDDAHRRANQTTTAYDPWQFAPASSVPMMQHQAAAQDPFYASSSIAPPHIVQMDMMQQQHQQFIFQQQQQMNPNPFSNPFGTATNPLQYYGATGMQHHVPNAYTGQYI